MCIFHCQGLPFQGSGTCSQTCHEMWLWLMWLWLQPSLEQIDWRHKQQWKLWKLCSVLFCTDSRKFWQIYSLIPSFRLNVCIQNPAGNFLDRMPCWTGSPGTLSDTSCTGHHGWFDGEDSSSVIHIPSQYMYVSEIGINTRPFQQGKWWWTHEALDLGIPNLETNAYCPFHQEREGKGQIQRQYPAVVPSNSDKLLVPITVLSWWQCFPVQISVIWHLEEHIEGVERLLGVLSSETVWSAVDTKSSNPISILYCYQEDDGRCQPAPPLVFLCVSHIVFFVMRMSPC